MLKQSALIILIFHILIKNCYSSIPDDIANTSAECLTNSLETSLYCRGSRAINNIINNLSKSDKPIVIVRGFEIVPSNGHNNDTDTDNDNNISHKSDTAGVEDDDNGEVDNTFLGRFSRYLRTHELNIKFSDLMPSPETESSWARDLEQSGIQMNSENEARKKDKGTGMIMLLGLMMSKMMAVMGLGGIGALAMKALGVAMTALMMAALVGVKSLASHGNESSHSVQYVSADGHHHRRRRRRSIDMSDKFNIGSQSIVAALNDKDKLNLPSLVYRGWPK